MATQSRSSSDPAVERMIEQVIQAIPKQAQAIARQNLPLVANALKEEGILTPNVLAYAMATIQHETANSFRPVNEGFFNDDKYGYDPGFTGKSEARKRRYKGGENYYGRGFIQLTHDYNYKEMGQKLGMGDALVKNPELANDPEIAAKILARYFKDRGTAALAEKGDFSGARGTINSKDYKSYTPIAETAKKYKNVLGASTAQDPTKEGYQHIGEGVYYKRDPKNPKGYDLIRTGQTPAPSTPSPTPYDATGVAPVKRGFFGRPGADASNPAQKIMRSIVPQAHAAEPIQSTQSRPMQSVDPGFKRSYTQQYAQEYAAPYTVKAGDTLWAIAERTLGSGQRWKELGGHAGSPKNLPVGSKINIPMPPKPSATPMQSRPNQSTPSAPMPPRSTMVSPSFTPMNSAGQSAQTRANTFMQASTKAAKPAQSTAAGGNIIGKLLNKTTNLFRR